MPDRSPFPPRRGPAIRADSIAEVTAYLTAWPAEAGPWQTAGQMLVSATDAPEDHLTVRAPDGAMAVLRFAIGSFYGDPGASRRAPGERVTAAMRAGHDLAKAEGPLHPGTMPLYPVPAAGYPRAVAVPLPILAIDAGERGLYAPPRLAVVRWPGLNAVGVGDAPGFDPERWPPPRLGEWPPPTIRDWSAARLAGAIERFTAIWSRLLDAWFSGETYPQLADERVEAVLLLALLLPAPLLDFYAELSPRFWRWLADEGHEGPGGEAD
ncbi:MAG: hypothetical protein U0031_07050 [Thermomicrobiales bacterium]